MVTNVMDKLTEKTQRLTLDQMDLSVGKKTRLYRLLYEYGPGNGTLLVLPIDQGLEHGPMDFFVNPDAADPEFQFKLALEGGYSGIACHIGLAEKYHRLYAGRVPLVLKLNGKTCVPPDDDAFSPLTSTVEDAVRLGADAVGYTLFVGSPSQDRDIEQFNMVRQEAERFGLPIIMWAYPRGTFINQKGGKNSLYAVDYAARVACELGADVVKVNFPETTPEMLASSPKPYNEYAPNPAEAVRKIVRSAGRSLVIMSGGSRLTDDQAFDMAKMGIENGASGLIFGRNMWQRPMNDALALTQRVKEMMRSVV